MASNSEWLARKLLELEQQVQALGRGTRLGHSSLQGESILALDEDGEVLAELGTEGGAGGVVHLDGPEPPRPTAPVLEQGVGTIFVRWDGAWHPLDEGDEGEPPTTPIDFDRIEVHATTDPEATEWDEDTLAGSITQRNGGVVMIRGWDIDDVVIVRLVCRSLADKLSEPSEPAEVTVTGIDIAAIAEELDAANVELSNLDGTMFAVGAELDALAITFKNLDASIINTDDGTLAEALDDARQALEDVRTEAKDYTDQATDGLADAVTAAQGQADAAADAAAQASSDAAAAAQQAADAAGVAAAKGDVLIQSTTPATAMRKDTTLWIDTTDGNNTPKRWSGSAWVAVTDRASVDAANAAATAQQAADAAQSTAEAAQQAATAAGTVADQAASAAATAQQAADAAQAEAAGAASDAAAAAGIAEGKGDVLIQSTTPATAMRKATTLWIDTTGGGNTPKRWSGSAWVAVTDKVALDAADAAASAQQAADAAQSTADAAAAAAAAAQSTANEAKASADGKNRINRSTSQPPAQYDGRVDDVWWVLSSLGSGGRVLSQWRWNGTAWVSELIDSALVAHLDAAKITSGTIDVDRLAAGSITADKLLIGGAANLFPDQDLTYSGGYGSWSVVDGGLERNGSGAQSGTYWAHTEFEVVPGERLSCGFTRELEGAGEVALYIQLSPSSTGASWGNPQKAAFTTSAGEASGTVTIPAYARKARMGLYVQSSVPAGQRVRVTGIRVRRMTGATLIENGAITADKVAADAIGARAIAADAVEAGKIAADSISGREIIANTVKAEHIASFTITADELAANSVSTDKLVANSVIADKLAANSVTAEKIAALAVTADKIEANAVTADKIAANAITAGKIEADALNFMRAVGLELSAPLIKLGDAVEITEAHGIRQFGPDGALNVDLPSDGSPAALRGDFSARRLTAQHMQLSGDMAVAASAEVVLDPGVTAPAAAPQVSAHWPRVTLPSLTSQERAVGIARGEGHWWRLVTTSVPFADGGRDRIEKIGLNGALVSEFNTSERGAVGFTYLNGELCVLVPSVIVPVGSTVNIVNMVYVYGADGTYKRRWEAGGYRVGTYGTLSPYRPGIGNDNTNVVIAQCDKDGFLNYWRRSPSTGALVNSHNTGDKFNADVRGVFIGSADFGGQKLLVAKQTPAGSTYRQLVVYDLPGHGYNSGLSWYTPNREAPAGLSYDGTYFWTLNGAGNLVRYSRREGTRVVGDDSANWWLAASWRNNPAESLAGPAQRFTWPHRAELLVTVPDIPQGVTGVAFFAARQTSEPVRTNLHWVAEINEAARTVIIPSMSGTWSNDRAPVSVSSFTEQQPGEIRSMAGNFRVDGLGVGSWGPLEFHEDGTMTGLPRVASGYVAMTDQVAGQTSSLVVTLPAGVFSSNPSVLVTPSTSVPYTTVRGVSAGGASPDSFTLYVNRTNTTNTGVAWIAIERTV